MNKLEKARAIVQQLLNIKTLPISSHWKVKKLMQREMSSLDDLYQRALSAKAARNVSKSGKRQVKAEMIINVRGKDDLITSITINGKHVSSSAVIALAGTIQKHILGN